MQGSQNSNPSLSQPGFGRLYTQGLQPQPSHQMQVRPFSSIMRSTSMQQNTLTLSQSQQQQQQQQQYMAPAQGVAKPFSQLRRTDTQATAGLGLPLQQHAGLQQHLRPATPPSQGLVFSQPSHLPESDQMTTLAPCSQQPLSQPAPIPFTAALGNAPKPLHNLQGHQHQGARPGSSNSYGDVPASSSLRLGSAPAAVAAAAAKQPLAGVYNRSSLGKALGQELEGRKVLEAIEGMQVRLSELEASCRGINTLGLTITDSASKLEELAVLHHQLASSVESVRGMVAQQQVTAAEQQATLALVASAATAGGLRGGAALQDAVVQTDTPPHRFAVPSPCPYPAGAGHEVPGYDDAFGMPSSTSFRQRRSLVVRRSIQVAEQVEEEYEAGFHGGGWAAGMQSMHAHAQPRQPRRQQQAPEQQQQQQQQWNPCMQTPLTLPDSKGGRPGIQAGADAGDDAGAGAATTEAHLAGMRDRDVCPIRHPPALDRAHQQSVLDHAHQSALDRAHQQPALDRAHQQRQGQQAACHSNTHAAFLSMRNGALQIGAAQPTNNPRNNERATHAEAALASKGGWISRKHSTTQPVLPPAKRHNSGGVIARMSGKLEQSSKASPPAACPIVPAPSDTTPAHDVPTPAPSGIAQGVKGGRLACPPPCPAPPSQTARPFQGIVGEKKRQQAAGTQVAAAPAKKTRLSAASLLASPEMPAFAFGRQPLLNRDAPARQRLPLGHHVRQQPGQPNGSTKPSKLTSSKAGSEVGAGKRTNSKAGFEVAEGGVTQAPHSLRHTRSGALPVGYVQEGAIVPSHTVGAGSTSQSSTSKQPEGRSRSGGAGDLEAEEDLARQVAEKMRQHRSRRLRKCL